jgi:hypothetical protein
MNVFEMCASNNGPGFWVRRITWGGTVARVVRVGKFTKAPPYCGNPSVLVDIYSMSGELRDPLVDLPAAGTGTYKLIDPPAWAETVSLRPLDDPEADAALHQLNKKRGKAYKDTSDIEKVWLKVLFDRKDEAKALDARWSPEDKKWWLAADKLDALEKAKQKKFIVPEVEE